MAKYKTGDLVMIPAEIVAAIEEDGKTFYETRTASYRVPEDSVRVDATATAQMEFDKAMREMSEPRYYGW